MEACLIVASFCPEDGEIDNRFVPEAFQTDPLKQPEFSLVEDKPKVSRTDSIEDIFSTFRFSYRITST